MTLSFPMHMEAMLLQKGTVSSEKMLLNVVDNAVILQKLWSVIFSFLWSILGVNK